MIDDAIEYLRREVRDSLGLTDTEVVVGNVHALRENNAVQGVYLSLVNTEEEFSLKNTPHYTKVNGSTKYKQPPVFLNVYLMLAFDFQDYSASLLRLSQTIELFQHKPTFSADNETLTNPLPAAFDRLNCDLYNLNFEQLNHLWGVLGGAFLPSVLYKVRIMRIQRDETKDAPEVKAIEVDTRQS